MSRRSPTSAKGEQRRLTVILKATDACNGACRFCSVGTPEGQRMTEADFDRLADELERLTDRWGLTELNVTFHGGEPTLLGAGWLGRACDRLERLPTTLRFDMQSNLLELDDEVLAVIRDHHIGLGTSIDPLSSGRCQADGSDAFPRWLESYAALAEAGTRVGAIFVVTRAALGQARQLYTAAEALSAIAGDRFGLQVNPVYGQGHAAEATDQLITAEELGQFLVELWREWEGRGRSVGLTPIERFVTWFESGGRTRPGLACGFGGDCSTSHVGVDYDLNVAGCGRRLDADAYSGNLRQTPLWQLLEQSEEKRLIASRWEALAEEECADCRFQELCHGGCPDDAALSAGGVSRRTSWCQAYRTLFEALEAAEPPRSSRVTARPRPDSTVTVLASDRVALLAEAAASHEPPLELWVLPTDDGRAVSYDSALSDLAGRGARLRLWLQNRHVRALRMWTDLLRTPGVEVTLFEADGLAGALNLLNSLRATISLDLPTLLDQAEGPDQVSAALERFLHDPLWRSQVLPFSQMLADVVQGRLTSPTIRSGHWPGRVRLGLLEAGGLCPPAVASVERNGGLDPARWLLARRGCLGCELLRCCGGQLSQRSLGRCQPEARALVEQIAQTGAELRRVLEGEDRPR